MKLFVIGLVLTLIILLPRILPLFSSSEPASFDNPVASNVTGALSTDKSAGSSVLTTEALSVTTSQGDRKASQGDRKASQDDRKVPSSPVNSSDTLKAGELSQSDLAVRVSSLEKELAQQKEVLKKFMTSCKKEFGQFAVSQQISDFKTAKASDIFKVPEWAVPWCHKSNLKGNDLKAFYKLGIGMVHDAGDNSTKEVLVPLQEMLIFHFNKMKLSDIRIYRESSDHVAGKLGDLVPPAQRCNKAPYGLPVSSVHLNGTLQVKYSVSIDGELKIMGALYSIPKGELVHKCVKSGTDYEFVVKSLSREFAGFSQKLVASVKVEQ